MNRLSDNSAQVALAIATLQHRKKVYWIVGISLLGLTMVMPLFYLAKFNESTLKVVSDDQINEYLEGPSDKNQEPVLGSVSVQGQEMQMPQLATETLRGLEALTVDPQYGEFARRLIFQLDTNGRISNESLEKLDVVLAEKLASMDSSLRLAVKNNDLPLLEVLMDAKFFKDYAAERLSSWSWLIESTRYDYITASMDLTSAEVSNDAEAELDALYAIRSITGQNIHAARIGKLETEVEEFQRANLQSEFAGLMAAGKYGQLLQRAGTLRSKMADDPVIKGMVLQAQMAKAKQFRDEIFSAANAEAKADNWRAIPDLLSRVPLNMHGQEFQNLQNRSTKIVRLQEALVDLLLEPGRLVDGNVQKYAKKQLANAAAYEEFSPALSRMIGELESEIEVADIAVQLLIESDNRATILIPGLGYVEPTVKKSLWLSKKRYNFIVRCAGKTDVHNEIDLRGALATEPSAIRLACGS